VLGFVMLALCLLFLVVDSHYISVTAKLVFLPLKLSLALAFVISYVSLLNGREILARRVVAVAVVGGVTLALVLTGGFPQSPAAATVLLPAIIFYCIYGARAGAWVAVLMPVLVLLLYLAEKSGLVQLPNFASPQSPDLNIALALLACHVVAVLAVASYERNNRQLSQRLDAELTRHAALANLDALTGLYNARYFDQQLRHLLAQPGTWGEGLVVVYCDLDNFKPINDQHGHAVGDQVLAAVGKRLHALTKHGIDVAARIGGDEFAILLVNCKMDGIPQIVERLRQAATAPILYNGMVFEVGISIGHSYVQVGRDGPRATPNLDASHIVQQADAAMYRDKARKAERLAPTPAA
jgi:diguanylate cyclase (GGDEF)-like protein